MLKKSKIPKYETRANRAYASARDKYEYCRLTSLLGAEIENATSILDVCGGSSTFAQEVNQISGYPKVQVVDAKSVELALDTSYAHQGYAQELQFPDNSFDHTLMIWGAAYMSKEDALKAFREMLRVTKTGGTVRINPINPKKLHWSHGDEPSFGSAEFMLYAPSDKHGKIPSEATLICRKPETESQDFHDTIDQIANLDLLRPGPVLRRVITMGGSALNAVNRYR